MARAVRYSGYIPTELKEVIEAAQRASKSNKVDKFLWDHSLSEEQYAYFVSLLKAIAGIEFVTWRRD